MTRDLDQLVGRTFDVLVVGGGIYGLTIAYDAAQRGLSVALIERDDFGSGASFNHHRTIHGGLRYLQSLDIARARESVRERRTLAAIAPHTVRPLPFAMALYRSLPRGRLAMRAGFALDRLVGFDRNHGVTPSHRLPAGRVVSKDDAIGQFPGLRRQGLTGAAVWYDYVTTEADRLTFSFALAASQHGAVLANHVEATELLVDGRRVAGVRARDETSARVFDVRAQVTVNATGAAVDRLLEPHGIATRLPMLKAMNLVTRREAGDVALGARAASGRTLFLVPWRGRALFGTWESGRAASAAEIAVTPSEIAQFIGELNQAFPTLDLSPADVTLVHRGIVPAVARGDGRVALEGRDQIHDAASRGVEGLVTVAGTKFTTARGVAERVIDRLLVKLGRPRIRCRTAHLPLPGGSVRDFAFTVAEARHEFDAVLPTDAIPHLVSAYGSRYRDILDLCASRPEWRARVGEGAPVIAAEIVWAARHEMAVTLADAVMRRTPLGALGYPGDDAVARASALVAAELGWSPERARDEVAALRAVYEIEPHAGGAPGPASLDMV